jgi:hypothetical protein
LLVDPELARQHLQEGDNSNIVPPNNPRLIYGFHPGGHWRELNLDDTSMKVSG